MQVVLLSRGQSAVQADSEASHPHASFMAQEDVSLLRQRLFWQTPPEGSQEQSGFWLQLVAVVTVAHCQLVFLGARY